MKFQVVVNCKALLSLRQPKALGVGTSIWPGAECFELLAEFNANLFYLADVYRV